MKKVWSNPQQVDLHHNTIKMFYEHGPSEARFPSYGLLAVKENTQNVRLDLQQRTLPS
jgi:hypothetical protein